MNCKLPNLLIAGVHKAGSTSLYTYLSRHPQVCASFTKEINFFTPLLHGRPIGELAEYAKHFEPCGGERYRMEASPSYIYGKETIAERIKTELGAVKIIVILRDPTDRLISLFSRAVSKAALPEDLDFQSYISIAEKKRQDENERDVYSTGIREGIYIDYIQPWQSVFGADFKIVFFDDLRADAFRFTADICEWLGLDPNCFTPQDFRAENKTLHYRYRGLHRYMHEQYMKYEPFWRRHRRLKHLIRSTYNIFNAGTEKRLESIDDAAVLRLRKIFEPHNNALRSFLLSNNYTALPSWLR